MSHATDEAVAGLGADDAEWRLRALADVARAAGSPGAHDVLRTTARAARVALRAASVSLSVWERDNGQVRCILNEGDLGPTELEEPVDEIYPFTGYGFMETFVTQGVGYVRWRGDPHQDAITALLTEYGKGSCLGVPVLAEGRVWGELFVTRHVDEPPFTERDLDFATAVAAQVGAAVATAEHVARVSRLAYTDPLTGLANRRAVDERLDAAMQRCRERGTTVSLVVCDVNGLKRVNDEHGHDAGDRVLVRFAGLLSACAGLTSGAVAGRSGGDEFCMVFEGPSADQAVAVAEELCRLAGRELADGVACGVASTGDDVGPVDTPARLFRLADAAQYRAKRSGASRPVVAGRSLPAEATARFARAPSGGDRRRLRGREHTDPVRLVDVALATLDHAEQASPRERLELLCDVVARHVDALGWWLSAAGAGDPVVRTVGFSLYRASPGSDPSTGSVSAVGAEFALADYPLTRSALSGGAFVVEAEDPYADPAEVAILDGMGATSLLCAGGPDRSGTRHLVEVYGDELSRPLGELVGVLRALVAVAVQPGPECARGGG